MFTSCFLWLKVHHSGSVECQSGALIWSRGQESDCHSWGHPYCFPINIFRINELIGECKKSQSLIKSLTKRVYFSRIWSVSVCPALSTVPQTPGALAGTLYVVALLKYNSSGALVIDHRLCPSHLDFFLTSHLLIVMQYLIKNSLERHIMLVRKVRYGYYLSTHEVVITIVI